ncbi:tape measure protein [Buttiauxella sp. S04-F03]|uniref:tape measure protein n=1 Tax=Buttiauxella sp. W03-F01 TaxID=2904524 RepID=UPI001E56085F|nr:tape measure protein [Buttiauxella sp. W03-F01]MCE0801980.1 tape measure protein [Buttiauxella sp. W03-F01]
MTTETARLLVVASSTGLDKLNKELSGVQKGGSSAEKATNGLLSVIKGFAAPVLAAVSATAALNEVINVTREFESLRASLEVATGSAQNASQAFGLIQQFAATTPYSLQESTQAFINLVNLGLNPSEEAMRSYGNTASSLGKSLDDMVQAVADAATGEFERLKEFGIKTKSNGDTISFTFRGVTETVKNSSAEIQRYLQDLGNNDFAGAMDKQSQTLNGVISNLGDNWNQLVMSFSQSGPGDIVKETLQAISDGVQDVNSTFTNGNVDTVLHSWEGSLNGIEQQLDDIFGAGTIEKWAEEGVQLVATMVRNQVESLLLLPATIEDFIAEAKADLIYFGQLGEYYALEFYHSIADRVNLLISILAEFGNQVKNAASLKGFDAGAIASIFDEQTTAIQKNSKAREENLQKNKDQHEYNKTLAVLTYQTRKNDIDSALDNNPLLSPEDTSAKGGLGQYGKQGDAEAINGKSGGKKKAGGLTADSWENYYQNILQAGSDTFDQLGLKEQEEIDKVGKYLKAGVASTEEAQKAITMIHENYAKKREDIAEKYDPMRAATDKLRDGMVEIQALEESGELDHKAVLDARSKLDEDYFKSRVEIAKDNAVSYADAMRGEYDPVQAAQNEYDTQLAQLQAYHEAGFATEQDFADKRHALYTTLLQKQSESQNKEVLSYSQSASTIAGSMADTLAAIGERGSGAYKVMFAASKAFGIAQATLNLSTAISQVMADPTATNPMLKFANMAAVAAAGASLISQVSAVGMAHDGIDNVPKEGTWLLDRGERVVDRRTNADLKDFLANGGNSGSQPVQITQHFTISGSGDKQLESMLQQAAQQGAKEGYQMVIQDFATNGQARKMVR